MSATFLLPPWLTRIKALVPLPRSMNRQPPAPAVKLFSTTRTKRNTALFAMLVWLFALASGVVNACLLETHASNRYSASDGVFATADAPAVVGHDQHSDTSKAPCLKVCDQGQNSLPKQESGAAQADPGPAPLFAVVWIAATGLWTPPLPVEDTLPPLAGLPLRLRYVRLAL